MGFCLLLAAWVVAQPVVNMHARPSADASVVSQAIYAAPVTLREVSGEWGRIETADGYPGWVELRSIKECAYGSGRLAWVDWVAAHLYREPDVTKHAPVLTLPYDARLEVAGGDGERWIEVRLVEGGTAWVQRGDLRFDDAPISIGQMLEVARRFLGRPYTWGGTSSFGFDCSGFTQTVFRRRGIVLPRDSGPQSRWEGAVAVSRAALQPGDLLFFGEKRVTHTGIYLGGGEFIHATAHEFPRIQISRLDSKHWSERLLGCRRPR